ncbi:hypothetical protein BDP27DRAFT_1436654 [Rhodocollybia butyracea]|uniref:Uncharacterized protein n=1 Tax=Rhodocollybia butyracea TaxID=206335 RepID=A0A9P5P575_9AGAR|nr:hypothetical protein BDP27DRAFT_1436654 [Rhodocollybia butyracea]
MAQRTETSFVEASSHRRAVSCFLDIAAQQDDNTDDEILDWMDENDDQAKWEDACNAALAAGTTPPPPPLVLTANGPAIFQSLIDKLESQYMDVAGLPPIKTTNPVSLLSLPDSATSSSALCSDAITINPAVLAISPVSESVMNLSSNSTHSTAVPEVSSITTNLPLNLISAENLMREEESLFTPENTPDIATSNSHSQEEDEGDLSILHTHISRALKQVPQQAFLHEHPLFHVRCEVGALVGSLNHN